MDSSENHGDLIERIRELEAKVEHLRVSRRVLMNLVSKLEEEKCSLITRLEKEKHRLEISNAKYARALWEKNRMIVALEGRLRQTGIYSQEFPNVVKSDLPRAGC